MLDKAKTPTLAKDHQVSHSILLPKITSGQKWYIF